MGDYNIDLSQYPHSPHAAEIIHDLASSPFIPLVSIATRANSKHLTLIDNIFTNDLTAVENSETRVIKNSTSDHFPI